MFVSRQHRGRRCARAVFMAASKVSSRLAGLRDADHEIARADDRVAVPIFRGDLDLDRDPRPLLDRVAADQAGVVGGAAGDDHHPAAARPCNSSSIGE